MSDLSLYIGKDCHRSVGLLSLVEALKIPCSIQELSPSDSLLERTSYGHTPFLKHGDQLIEDVRLILLYIDETFFDHYMRTASESELVALYEDWEILDTEIFPALTQDLGAEKIEALKKKAETILEQTDFTHPLTCFPASALLANIQLFGDSKLGQALGAKLQIEKAVAQLQNLYESFGTSPIGLAGTPATMV